MSTIDTFGQHPYTSPGQNPLEKYYRIPGLHVKLPTNGVFMPAGSIAFTASGEVPVFPIAAKDELLLKSPDALMSGHALEKLIESCVPAIRMPRLISTQDLDVLLLAIRAATYGNKMNLDATCPKCETVNEIVCDLPSLLATMKPIDPDNHIRISPEVIVYIRPYNLQNAILIALASYHEARRLRSLDEQEPKLSQMEKTAAINASMDKISKLNLDTLSDCILKIVVPGSEVIDKNAIAEFVSNVPKPWVEQIEKKLRQINSSGIDKSLHVTCCNENCKHEWKTEVEFNPSNFFDAAS